MSDETSTETSTEISIEAPVEDILEGNAEVRPENDSDVPLRVDELDPEAPLADALEQGRVVPLDEDDYR